MKRIAALCLFLASLNVATAEPALNIAGTYNCTINSHTVFHSIVTYTLDPANTNFAKGYSAYSFKGISQFGTVYVGHAIANGNNLAIYTKNSDPKHSDDYGLEIVTISQSVDANAKPVRVLHNIGYGAPFNKNSIFFITCISQN